MVDLDAPFVPPVRAERAIPILPVRDLAASLAYYVGLLGFRLNWQDPGIIASVLLDRDAEVWLVEGDQGHAGTWVWFGVSDADVLHAAYAARGARVRLPPTNYPWAREFQVLDPDENVLRFASEVAEDAPLGPWLDMRGRRWGKKPEGGWHQV